MAIQIRELSLAYSWHHIHKQVLSNFSLDVETGSFLSITGSNGCGKSSLLRSILGLVPQVSGSISILGRDILPGKPQNLADLDCAYLPQNPVDFFLGETVEEELAMASGSSLVDGVASQFKLDQLMDRRTRTLSGGERQKLALAAFFASGRAVLMLDEPSSFLDRPNALLLKDALKDAHAAGSTVIHVTQYDDEISWGQQHLVLG